MRFDVHLRTGVRESLQDLAKDMRGWESSPRISDDEAERIRSAVVPFRHTTHRPQCRVAGVDGSGDFPAVTYADSFVYVTVAAGALYESDSASGLKELALPDAALVEFTWLPEHERLRVRNLDAALASLAGRDIESVVERSDYRALKSRETGRLHTVSGLVESLLRPHPSDTGNVAIQLRTTGELGVALRVIESAEGVDFVLVDGTLSLPLVSRVDLNLFYESLKRLCCVVARERGVGFVAFSKSHGLPGTEVLERLAADACGIGTGVAEHWYLRLPTAARDGWQLALLEQRRLPPPAVVTYLVRFHRSTPVMRLDMDLAYWESRVQGAGEEETRKREAAMFETLDYASHDQRAYGYPYPIKAAHDRASLTEQERAALRKQIIDAAVQAGMRRSLFRSAALATGHG